MQANGLLITGQRLLDQATLQGALDMAFRERFYRHKAWIANALIPFSAYDLSKEEVKLEVTTMLKFSEHNSGITNR